MKTLASLHTVATVLGAMSIAPLGAQEQQLAELGSCALEGGGVLEPCTVGYRTYGTLNAARDNAILIPTAYTGTTATQAGFAQGVMDTTSFFVISVDALGNGVSTSPSNSPTQGGDAFPEISIGDMVQSQYRLVTEVLGLEGLYAVTGISMGGMQTFEWAVSHPGFFQKAMPLIGSPQVSAYDVAVWESRIRLLQWLDECGCTEAAETLATVGMLTQGSPEYHERLLTADSVEVRMERAARGTLQREGGWKDDQIVQARAMIDHDVTRDFGGDMAAAAAVVTAELLSIVVATDHVVTPGPSVKFVDLLANGRSMVLENDCGHGGLSCTPFVADAIAFMSRD